MLGKGSLLGWWLGTRTVLEQLYWNKHINVLEQAPWGSGLGINHARVQETSGQCSQT